MSLDNEYDKARVNAVQGKTVKVISSGRGGLVANSYVLDETLYLYLKLSTGAYFWAEESDVDVL